MRRVTILFLGLLLHVGSPHAGAAQADTLRVGTCAPGEAEAFLDAGNVRARILNNGGLFWRDSPNVYEVPKGSGLHSIFTSALWIGGQVDGELRMAATRYSPYEFWPGPLGEDGTLPNPDDCSAYDHIWEITREDIERYNETGAVSDHLRAWPWQLGAPVTDGDGVPDNYNLDGGDRPALLGDQRLWWVMNDLGNTHEETETPPLGLEVHGSAFAFGASDRLGDITFYRYRLFYRGPAPLDSAYFGAFFDTDLGNFDDDYVGSDTTLQMGYTYNADNEDEGDWGYGTAPPALGVNFARGPLAGTDGLDNDRDGTTDEASERLGITSFVFFNGGGGVQNAPQKAQDYYNYFRGRWLDGRPITVGGDGRDFSEPTTPFMFSGDPTAEDAFWSEVDAFGNGISIAPADRRFVMSTGPFTMQPGEVQTIDFAIIWARGDDHLDSIAELRSLARGVRSSYDQLSQPGFRVPEPAPRPAPDLGFLDNYPNPFREQTTIRYRLPEAAPVRLTVYDVWGRGVATLVDGGRPSGKHEVIFEAGDLPPGLYLYRLQIGSSSGTGTMVLMR